jgi:hypothetical protein
MVLFPFLLELGTPAEGGDFDEFVVLEKNMSQAESAPDQPGIAEELTNLLRMGVCGHIKVLGGFAQQQIAYASPNEIGSKPVVVEPVENFQGIRVDETAGKGMLLTGENTRDRLFIHYDWASSYSKMEQIPTLLNFLTDRKRFVKGSL